MNEIQCKLKLSEIISLDKITEIRQKWRSLSKITSRYAKRFKLAFFMPKHRPTWHWFRRKPIIYRPPHRQKRIGAFPPYGVVDITK